MELSSDKIKKALLEEQPSSVSINENMFGDGHKGGIHRLKLRMRKNATLMILSLVLLVVNLNCNYI